MTHPSSDSYCQGRIYTIPIYPIPNAYRQAPNLRRWGDSVKTKSPDIQARKSAWPQEGLDMARCWGLKGKIDKDDEMGKSVRKSISTRSRRRRSLLSTRNSILPLTPSMHMLSLHTPCPQKAVHQISHHLLRQWTPMKLHSLQLRSVMVYNLSDFLISAYSWNSDKGW